MRAASASWPTSRADKSHDIIRQGLQILVNLDHRGAVGADPLVGDGAGCLIQMPDALLRDWASGARRRRCRRPATTPWRCASCRRTTRRATSRSSSSSTSSRSRARRWSAGATCRSTPTGLGKAVIETHAGDPPGDHRPRARELADQDAFERKILAIRKQTQNPLRELAKKHKLPGLTQLYMPSFSTRTVVYKGLLLAPQVGSFYEDLRNPLTESALALVHQRFSTNTFPSWKLAHPYRFIAHNGEINTVRGNVNWMNARRRTMESDLLGADLDKMWPLIPHGQSDTACLDNALELLVAGGYSLAHAMMMLIPEAWAGNPLMDPKRKAFYEYHAALMEPWDGPAAIAFTDGRQIGATLDRNGLRPARFIVTDDDHVIMASEVGVLPVPEEKIVRKWRLQPGKMLLIDLEEGRIIEDEEIKRTLAEAEPYEEWLKETQFKLEELPRAARARRCPRRRTTRRRCSIASRPSATPRRTSSSSSSRWRKERRRSDRLDGHRHADRRALEQAQAALQLLQAELRPGHQPADRSDPRGAGDVAGLDDRAAAEPARPPRRHAQAAGSRPSRS